MAVQEHAVRVLPPQLCMLTTQAGGSPLPDSLQWQLWIEIFLGWLVSRTKYRLYGTPELILVKNDIPNRLCPTVFRVEIATAAATTAAAAAAAALSHKQ